MRDIGYGKDEIRELSIDFYTPSLSKHDREAINFARRLSRSNPRPDESDIEDLQDLGFSPEAITELAAIATMTLAANRIGTIRDLDPPEDPAGLQRLYGLVSGFWKRIQAGWGNGTEDPEPYHRADYDGPGSNILNSLPPVPSLKPMERLLKLAWEPTSINRSTRALMLGVIGRLLGCPMSEEITREILKRENFSTTEIRDLLEQLDSPRLSELDRKLISISRASVWMQDPEPVLHQFRELEDMADQEMADETLVFIALANCMCRFTAVKETSTIDGT